MVWIPDSFIAELLTKLDSNITDVMWNKLKIGTLQYSCEMTESSSSHQTVGCFTVGYESKG